jgi:hypothetical protein
MKRLIILLAVLALAFMPVYPGWEYTTLLPSAICTSNSCLNFWNGYEDNGYIIQFRQWTNGCIVDWFEYNRATRHYELFMTVGMPNQHVIPESDFYPRMYCGSGTLQIVSYDIGKWLVPAAWEYHQMIPFVVRETTYGPYPAPK